MPAHFSCKIKFNFHIYSLYQVSIKHFSNINKYKKNTKVLILEITKQTQKIQCLFSTTIISFKKQQRRISIRYLSVEAGDKGMFRLPSN
jgi:hypothetical protein